MDNKSIGQYFTPDLIVQFMCDLSKCNNTAKVLEPSCGEGIFLKTLHDRGFQNVVGYEVDLSLKKLHPNIKNESFVSATVESDYDLVIGNPPYVRWKNLDKTLKDELGTSELWTTYCNSLCDYLYLFLIKSVECLRYNGELIFITPAYWMQTTHAQTLRNYLIKNGVFTDIYHFDETPVFEKVSSSIMIFRYVKHGIASKIKVRKIQVKKITKEVLNSNDSFIEVDQFHANSVWSLTDSATANKLSKFKKKCSLTLGDICHIGNGMVSGLDKAFSIPEKSKLNDDEQLHTLKVIKGKHLKPFTHTGYISYIFPPPNLTEEEFNHRFPNFVKILNPYRKELEGRYQYGKVIRYWEWVFLRNYKLFSQQKDKIFVPCKERITHKNYFRFALVSHDFYPTQDVTAIVLKDNSPVQLDYLLQWLNSKEVFEWIINKGIVKGGVVEFSEKPLSSIPIDV